MSDIIEWRENGAMLTEEQQTELLQVTDALLLDAETALADKKTMRVPIAALSAMGSELCQTALKIQSAGGGSGLYYVSTAGKTMFSANDGSGFIGSLKDAAGKVGGGQARMTPIAVNPTTMLMAATLYSLERKLDKIEEIQRQILDFLVCEKEAEIEADVQMLSGIVAKYKLNWDNEHYTASNHKMVLDIQRTALKNMRAYQKQVQSVIARPQLIVTQGTVKGVLEELQKKFKYYRMALATYSLASLLEIMLGGNYKEEYIGVIKADIEKFSMEYREYFEKASTRLEKLSGGAADTQFLKFVGGAGQTVGKFFGSIVKTPVDEFLQKGGESLADSADDTEKQAVRSFAALGNPDIAVFTERMEDMIRIYNHTEGICFDQENIYLLGETA